MNYRQWKKNYKKLHGVNPPEYMDKRKQRKRLKRQLETFADMDWETALNNLSDNLISALANAMRTLGSVCDGAGTVFRNLAENMRSLEIKGNRYNWEVKEDGSGYAIYESDALTGEETRIAYTYSERTAAKIAEILQADYLEYIEQISPDRIRELARA